MLKLIFIFLALTAIIFAIKVLSIAIKVGKYSVPTILNLVWTYFLIIFACSLLYMLVYMMDPISSFYNIESLQEVSNFIDVFVFWFYYSALILINTGIGDVQPASSIARIVVVAEILTKLLFGFIVANKFLKTDSEK